MWRNGGRRPRCTLALVAVLGTPAAGARAGDLASAQSVVRHRPADGVYALLQTPEGYLWLGTSAGLFRYDGLRFTRMQGEAGPAGRVASLARGRDGSIWVGTHGDGLFRLGQGRTERFEASGAAFGDEVLALAADEGGLWIGAAEGLFRAEATSVSAVGVAQGFGDREVRALRADGAGRLWVGARDGLWHGTGGRFRQVARLGAIYALTPDRWGRLWAGGSSGLFVLEQGEVRAQGGDRPGPKLFSVRSLHADGADALWVGTWTGLYRIQLSAEASGWGPAVKQLETTLTDTNVEALSGDADGNVWVGTGTGGLLRVRQEQPFASLGRPEGLPGATAFAVLAAREGDLWVTSGGHLARWRQGALTTFRAPEHFSTSDLRSIAQSRDGAIWVAGYGGALYRFDGERFRRHAAADAFTSGGIQSLFGDSRGTLWVALRQGGLVAVGAGRAAYHPPAEVGCKAFVQAMAEDPGGAVWFASAGSGLCRYEGGGFQAYTRKDGLASDDLNSLHVDREGTLWIGTFDRGLVRRKQGRFAAIGPRHGLKHEHVGQILEDERGHLWLTSRGGLFRVPKRQLDDVAEGRGTAVRPIAFGVEDGMRSGFCLFGFQPAGARADDGRLWIPTTEGVVVVDPRRLEPTTVPEVLVEEVLVDGSLVPAEPGRPLEVPRGRGNLEIRYTVAKFAHRHRIKFRYRLAGFDPDWTWADDRQTAYYTNLPSGRYRFEVAAWAEDGESERRAAREIAFLPPFHRTPVFYAICALALLLAAAGGLRLRLWQERQRFAAVVEERNRIARDLHDALEQGFVAIKLQLEAAAARLEAPEAARAHLLRATQLVERSVAEARGSVRALRTGIFGAADLPTALSVTAGQTLRGTPISFHLRTTGQPYRLAPEVEQQVARIVQEAITNVVKHAAAARIDAHLEFTDDALRVLVQDDGRGFAAAALSRAAGSGHYGVVGMHERAARIAGTLEVESRPGAGTRVALTVPRRPPGRR